jgi:hypothetical protein
VHYHIIHDVEHKLAYQHTILPTSLNKAFIYFQLFSALRMSQQGAALQSYNNELPWLINAASVKNDVYLYDKTTHCDDLSK